jgi:hypothetical protein
MAPIISWFVVYPWTFSNSIIPQLIFISSDMMKCCFFCSSGHTDCLPGTSTCFRVHGLPVSTSTLRPPFFESLHSFPQTHAVHDVLNCHFSMKPKIFHTLWTQKLDRHFLFPLAELCEWNSHAKLSRHYRYSNYNENHLDRSLGICVFLVSDGGFSLSTPSLRWIEHSFLYSLLLSLTFSRELRCLGLSSYCTCYCYGLIVLCCLWVWTNFKLEI